jgi:hypothetical protein
MVPRGPLGEPGLRASELARHYYEWVRTPAAALAFEPANPELAKPPGFSL